MSAELFYAERDQRTVEYGLDPFIEPIGIVVSSDAASSIAGQTATLALVNMAARIHRSLRLVLPDVPALVPSLVGAGSLAEAVALLVHAIDPFNDIAFASTGTELDLPRIAVGVGCSPGVPLSISANGYLATLARDVDGFGTAGSTIIGADLAACLGAAALVRMALGYLPAARRVSLWNFVDGETAMTGSTESLPPLDVGCVAVIGAGAVASSLAYWLRPIGVVGDWVFVDGDHAELHNTSRGLGLLAHHAGWVDGVSGHQKAAKAIATARLIGAESYTGWYDDWVNATGGDHPDLVVPLANGPGLRTAIAQRGEPILVHATTSRSWTGELHRHLAEADGCIACRLPELATATLGCSTSPLPHASGNNDAALPFLSGTAGLLLFAGLLHLANGRLAKLTPNHWQLHLDLPDQRTTSARRWVCDQGCSLRRNLPLDLRRVLPRGRRWSHLD